MRCSSLPCVHACVCVKSSGSATCAPCAAGHFSPGSGAAACEACAAGAYQRRSGAAYCDACESGTFSGEAASLVRFLSVCATRRPQAHCCCAEKKSSACGRFAAGTTSLLLWRHGGLPCFSGPLTLLPSPYIVLFSLVFFFFFFCSSFFLLHRLQFCSDCGVGYDSAASASACSLAADNFYLATVKKGKNDDTVYVATVLCWQCRHA